VLFGVGPEVDHDHHGAIFFLGLGDELWVGPGHDLEVAAVDAGEVEAVGEKNAAQQAASGDEECGAHTDHVGDGAPQQAAENY